MKRVVLKSKIHRATVTDTDIDYDGSLTLDGMLMSEADLIPYEQIQVYNITNGERFTTYLIKGKDGSGEVVVNGAAAKKARTGDMLIIAAYATMDQEEMDFFVPRIILVDDQNKIISVKQ
ncbi:MAG: aspartate 1-decarboxylase [Candidatus Aminicenantes bacterium]|jgi:aspartate 1-decarboxylase